MPCDKHGLNAIYALALRNGDQLGFLRRRNCLISGARDARIDRAKIGGGIRVGH